MLVKDRYQGVIREIMQEHCILQSQPAFEHRVLSDASFKAVVQYTDYYVGKGNADRPGNSLHYRYERYLRELRHLSTSEMRIAHVDIGCGAGAFSWAFLDKVRALGIKLDSVDLYGLDYCPAMICLAKEIRAKLINTIRDYPELRYCENVETLLQNLSEGHRKGTAYTITFGHILAQTQVYAPETIGQFRPSSRQHPQNDGF